MATLRFSIIAAHAGPRPAGARRARPSVPWLTSLLALALLLGLAAPAAQAAETPAAPQSTLAARLEQAVAKLAEHLPRAQGTIANLEQNGRAATLLLPADAALEPGQEFVVSRQGPVQRHPVTNQPLGRFRELLGVASITQRLPQLALARLFVSGGAQIAKGDEVSVPERFTILLRPVQNATPRLLNERSFNALLANAVEQHPRFTVRSLEVGEEPSQSTVLESLAFDRSYQVLLQPLLRPDREELRAELRLHSLYSQRTMALVGVPVPLKELEVSAPLVAAAPAVGVAQPARPLEGAATPPSPSPSGTVGKPTRALRNPELLFAQGYTNNAPAAPQNGSGAPLQSQTLRGDLLAFDVGDLDGDGVPELVASSNNQLFVYRWQNGQFQLSSSLKGETQDTYLSVDIADINGNGRAEVFVTNLHSRVTTTTGFENEMRSFVLEMHNGSLRRIWRKAPFFFRVIKPPERPGGILLAQRLGQGTPYEGAITELVWNGRAYARNPKFFIPEGFQIYGFHYGDLNGDSTPEIVLIGDDGYLRIFTPSGQLLFESSIDLGLNQYVKIEMNPPQASRFDQATSSSSFQPLSQAVAYPLKYRLLLADIDGDGYAEILTLANPPSGGVSRFLANQNPTQGGSLVAFGWTGASFAKLWETRQKRELFYIDLALLDPKRSGLPYALLLGVEKKLIGRGASVLQVLNFY
ncbi:MAG: VCBS repeat-containing protein [Candidatus Tectomicrobia bacterium]|nr:VCBS repeat-containing protein [Candidatus Tectomicrobia bacterium]